MRRCRPACPRVRSVVQPAACELYHLVAKLCALTATCRLRPAQSCAARPPVPAALPCFTPLTPPSFPAVAYQAVGAGASDGGLQGMGGSTTELLPQGSETNFGDLAA